MGSDHPQYVSPSQLSGAAHDFALLYLGVHLFDNCDLERTTFANTIIEKADFRTSYNYTIDPEFNRIRNAKFSLSQVAGLLRKHDIRID